MKISVITPSYNSVKTIENTIESVLNQQYEYKEYIIVDGGSTDGTVEIIKKYAMNYPNIIKYVSERDDGIYSAMNKGIKMATGELIGIINSDDYYEKDAFQIIAENLKGDGDYILYGMIRLLKDEKEYKCEFNHHQFLPTNMLCHPACFVAKSVYDKYGVFDELYKSAADYDFFLRLFYCNKVQFYPIYRILANFRLGGMSSSYISYKETNDIKYKHGCISYKAYLFRKLINWFKCIPYRKFLETVN